MAPRHAAHARMYARVGREPRDAGERDSSKAWPRREWALLVALSILWGGSFFFVGVAVGELPTLTIVVAARRARGHRASPAAVRVMGVALPREKRVWVAFAGMGLINNAIPFLLMVWGQAHIASGLASILNATTPLFTVIVAHACADSRTSA